MKRIAGMMLAVMGMLLGAQTVAAQEWSQPWARERIEKSPRHSEWVTVKHDGRNVETLVVYPESKDKRPVVLVIHEIFGLSDWAQELADEVAAAGYIAVAPDLLSGMAPNGGRTKDFPTGVTEAVSKLNPDQVTADLNAAADYGLKLPAVERQIVRRGILLGRRTELSALQQTAAIFPRRSFFTARRRPRTRCRASKRPFTASTPGTTRELAPQFRTRSPR